MSHPGHAEPPVVPENAKLSPHPCIYMPFPPSPPAPSFVFICQLSLSSCRRGKSREAGPGLPGTGPEPWVWERHANVFREWTRQRTTGQAHSPFHQSSRRWKATHGAAPSRLSKEDWGQTDQVCGGWILAYGPLQLHEGPHLMDSPYLDVRFKYHTSNILCVKTFANRLDLLCLMWKQDSWYWQSMLAITKVHHKSHSWSSWTYFKNKTTWCSVEDHTFEIYLETFISEYHKS